MSQFNLFKFVFTNLLKGLIEYFPTETQDYQVQIHF